MRIRVGDEGRVQLTNFGAAYLWPDVEKRFPPEVRGERSSPLPMETLANRVLHFGPEDVRRATEALPEPLRRIVAKALRPDPDERYETAGRMRDELRAFLDRPGRQWPFGAKEARTEAPAIFDQASDLEKLGAYPVVERGMLPLPPDMALESADDFVD
jgi:serine/threonine-protein kinase